LAQLVKLYDYISRYETNPFHYPTQFIRLKKQNWQRFSQKRNIQEQPTPEKKQQLIQTFLNQLLPFQYKWATSTITHQSYTDKKHIHDEVLTYFLQRFPDIYLIMYYPLFSIKKAPIDGEIILISPVGIEIIHVFKGIRDATIVATDNRTWTVETGQRTESIMSPLITLKRTEQIIASILKAHEVSLPIQKTVLSETNELLYHTKPYKTNMIGKREYETWFMEKRALQSPLKNIQLKAMEALLNHCQSTSVRRPEWKKDDDSYMSVEEFEET